MQTQGAFTLSLNSCFLAPGITNALRERLLRVLYLQQPRPKLWDLKHSPEMVKWIEVLFKVEELEALRKKACLLEDVSFNRHVPQHLMDIIVEACN